MNLNLGTGHPNDFGYLRRFSLSSFMTEPN